MSERLAGLDTRSKVLGGVMLVAVLGLLARLLLFGGSEEAVLTTPLTAPAPAVAAQPTEPPLLDDLAVDAVPGEADARSARDSSGGKDPFRALWVPPVGGEPVAPEAPEVPLVPVVEVPEAAGEPGPADGGSGTEPDAGPEVVVANPGVLELTAVEGSGSETTAVLLLDGAEHRIRAGESAGGIELLAVHEGPHPGQWTAVVQPSGSDPFDLVSGSPHTL